MNSPYAKKIDELLRRMSVLPEGCRGPYRQAIENTMDMMYEEELDELKKSTLGSYIRKASKSGAKHLSKGFRADSENKLEKGDKHFRKHSNRMKGISRATKKLEK